MNAADTPAHATGTPAQSDTPPSPGLGSRPLLWVLFALIVIAIPVTAFLLQPKAVKAPPPLATLPAFTLTNQDGKTVGRDDFKGRVWVANFVFTSCMGACPILTQKMQGVQEWAAELERKRAKKLPIALASFTVDPKTDTPEKLKEYGLKYKADFSRWSFLTGDLPAIEETIVKGFRMSMDAGMGAEEDSKDAPAFEKTYDIMHGERFVLVDWQGRIRGYYVTDREGLGKLSADIEALLSEMGAS